MSPQHPDSIFLLLKNKLFFLQKLFEVRPRRRLWLIRNEPEGAEHVGFTEKFPTGRHVTESREISHPDQLTDSLLGVNINWHRLKLAYANELQWYVRHSL